MSEGKEFFSPGHNRLLKIATWAKYLAWIALIVAFLSPVMVFINSRTYYQLRSAMDPNALEFVQALKADLALAFSVLLGMADGLIKGLGYFLSLKAVSLGLNMIVETDINYRERRREAGIQ